MTANISLATFPAAKTDVADERRADYFSCRDGVECAGLHLLVELWGARHLDDLTTVETGLRSAAAASRADVLDIALHHFGPGHGITGVALLAESHISIHTWPERDYAAVDIFMCGVCDPHAAIPALERAFAPERIDIAEHKRGAAAPEWFEETLHDDLRERLRVSRVLFAGDTGLQKLQIFENGSLGRVMTLDGVVQTTEADECAYHEMMAHVPILAHGAVARVLIVGGGDGGCLEEVLKHPVEKAVMVEIDEQVIELSRRHLPGICKGAFDNPRAEIVIGDGAKYVAETGERFDVILIDSPDPIGPAEVLFGEDFYAGCRRALRPGGIVVTQNGVPFLQADELRTSHARLSALFADVAFYLTVVPTYNGGFMTLGWASDDPRHRAVDAPTLEARYAAAELATQYYNPAMHVAAFALPNFIRAMIA